MTASDVRYRENAYLCLTPLNADEEFPGEMAADDESDANHSTYLDEDWQLPKNSEYPSPARNVLGSSVMRRVLKKSNCTGVVDQDGEWFCCQDQVEDHQVGVEVRLLVVLHLLMPCTLPR